MRARDTRIELALLLLLYRVGLSDSLTAPSDGAATMRWHKLLRVSHMQHRKAKQRVPMLTIGRGARRRQGLGGGGWKGLIHSCVSPALAPLKLRETAKKSPTLIPSCRLVITHGETLPSSPRSFSEGDPISLPSSSRRPASPFSAVFAPLPSTLALRSFSCQIEATHTHRCREGKGGVPFISEGGRRRNCATRAPPPPPPPPPSVHPLFAFSQRSTVAPPFSFMPS